MINIIQLLAKAPPEVHEGLARTLGAILDGQPDAAEREARLTAETVAAKLTIDAAYEAGAKTRE
jgi:hypothetical protein